MTTARKRLIASMLAMALCGLAHADGIYFDAASRTDMVYDDANGIIYTADGNQVLRYDVIHNYPLAPMPLGANLQGIDISPDGKTLAVADGTNYTAGGAVHLVNVDTLVDTPATLVSGGVNVGFFDVKYARDGTLFVTSSYALSTDSALHRLDPSTLSWTAEQIPAFYLGSRIATGSDRATLALVQANVEPPSLLIYHAAAGTFQLGGSPPGFANDIGINADGTQFAVPTYSGTAVYDASYHLLTTFNGPGVQNHPVAVAYHPVDAKLYMPIAATGEVLVYDTNSFQQIGSYNFQDTFQSPSYSAFQQGHTRLSNDGSILMVSVTGGVRFVQMYASLAAAPVTATSNGHRTTMTLKGSIGNNGTISYALDSQPSHGQAFVDGSTLTYVPAVGFSGTDTFTYAAYYGRAKVTSTVTVTVTADTTPYAPVVSFNTLPVLRSTTASPSGHVPGDFTGDGSSDLLWFNPSTSQLSYWVMNASRTPGTSGIAPVTRNGAFTYNVTPGYYVGAIGDFNGDGYADVVYTSANRDLWMWTNDQHGHFTSTSFGTYPANWQLVGAADIDGDGNDDLLWVDPSDCQFAYWLMKGSTRVGARTVPVTCGYYPVGIGYYSPSGMVSILWSSAANDLWVWDSHTGLFTSYNLSNVLTQLGTGNVDPRYVWAFGGGWMGQGIGVEWYNPANSTGFGSLLSRTFVGTNQTAYQMTPAWAGGGWVDKPESGGYQLLTGANGSGLYVLDKVRHMIGTSGVLVSGTDFSYSGTAPVPEAQQWSYPVGWYLIGAPSNGAQPLPWR